MSQIRFKYINLLDSGTVYRYSSQLDGMPAVNVQEPIRLKAWRTDSGFGVTPYNQKLPFRDTATGNVKSATIASGTYQGSALAGVIEAAMDAAGTYTGHSVVYNSTTKKFIFTKAGSASILSLLFNNTTLKDTTLAILLGFAHATDYTGATAYSSPDSTMGNEHEIIIALSASSTLDSFILDKHNLTSGTVMRLRLASTATAFNGGWNSSPSLIMRSSTITVYDDIVSIEFTSEIGVKALQLYWHDRSQAYSQIGRLWAGIYFTPEKRQVNHMTWAEKRIVERTEQKISEGGATLIDRRDPLYEYDIDVDPLDPYYNPLTKTGFETLFDTVGNHQAFYVSFDSEDVQGSTFYGLIVNDTRYQRLKNTPVLNVAAIKFREQK